MPIKTLKMIAPITGLYILLFSTNIGYSQNIQWPSFRGPNGTGISDGYPLPVSWDIENSKNILWKTSIPGLGLSSPIIWEDKVFVSTSVGEKRDQTIKPGLYGNIQSVNDNSIHHWIIYCLDKNTGRILWEKVAYTGVPKIKRHTKSTHANSSLATDGKHVVAFFGSEGIYCYDMNGTLLWSRNFGILDSGYFVAPQAQWEFGSSPIIYNNMVIIQCDVQKDSFIAALNINDGSTLWKTPRSDVPTWSTPSIHVSDGTAQVVVNGYKHIGGYDAVTGQELWRMDGGGDIPVPTPVIYGNIAFITSAHGPKAPIYAVKLDARGDISLRDGETSNKHIVWSRTRDGAYMATPLVYGDCLYVCELHGVLSCYGIGTGKVLYQKRLGGGAFTASPVAGDGKIYINSEDGDVYIIKAGPDYQVLGRNSLDEISLATPAISEGIMIFRTKDNLVAISQSSPTQLDK